MAIVTESGFDWSPIYSFIDVFTPLGVAVLALVVLSVLSPWGSYRKTRYAAGVLLFWYLVPILPAGKSIVFLPNYLIIAAIVYMLGSVVLFGKKVKYCTGLGFFSSFVVIGLFAGMTIEPISSYFLGFIHYPLVPLLGFCVFTLALTTAVFAIGYIIHKMLLKYNAVCDGVECSRLTLSDFWQSYNEDTLPVMFVTAAYIFTASYFYLTSEYTSMFVVTIMLYVVVVATLAVTVGPKLDQESAPGALILFMVFFAPVMALANSIDGVITREDAVIVFAIHGLLALFGLIVAFCVGANGEKTEGKKNVHTRTPLGMTETYGDARGDA